jgi:integrase
MQDMWDPDVLGLRSGLPGDRRGHLDASALRRRYVAVVKRADLRQLPFHSLRHYFGSMAVNRA